MTGAPDVTGVLALVGAVLVLVAVAFAVQTAREAARARRWPAVPGTVVELRFVNDVAVAGGPAARVYRVRARFRTQQGREVTALSTNRVRLPIDAVGTPITVSYDPDRPERCLVGRPGLRWCAVVAVLALLAGGAFFLRLGLG